MESREEMPHQTEENYEFQEKEEPNELTSDRESSVESFHTNKSEISTAAESELIDVDDIELSDEESWLYKSPKKLPYAERARGTHKWLHKGDEQRDDLDLRITSSTKDALVSKLNQLQMNRSVMEKKILKDNQSVDREEYNKNKTSGTVQSLTDQELQRTGSSKIEIVEDTEQDPKQNSSITGKENEVLDVAEVHKIAQLQEESLRQSTCQFLNLGEKVSFHNRNHFLAQNTNLSKPASVEALNVCNGKLDDDASYNFVPMHKMKKQNGYGSSSSLHITQDSYRGSLPNINPGYYSLRSKKSKKPNDVKIPCPLPIYPPSTRLPLNGVGSDAPGYESQKKVASPLSDYRESRTLPSSYRIHSRSNSSSRRDLCVLSPSPRRESTPFLPNSRNSPTLNFTRRESTPCNGSKYISPLSSPTLYQRSKGISSPVLQSPTKSWRIPPKDLKTPQSTEYHRNSSHSPSRRLPLTTVHNRTPKRGNSPASPRNEELRTFKLSSKIPSPGPTLRSGIPVPSTYMPRGNSDDESWSNDCY